MWTATLLSKSIEAGRITVNIRFDGTYSFNELYAFRTGNELDSYIATRLSYLEQTESYFSTLEIGPYTPVYAPALPDEKVQALGRLQDKQRLVDLNVISKEDSSYTLALAEAQESFKK